MKINFISIIITLTFLQSCTLLKNYRDSNRVIEIKYDHKPLLLKAPEGACLYNEKDPREKDIINVVRDANYNTISKIEFIFQDCEEKAGFLDEDNSLFRKTGLVILYKQEHLKLLKKYNLERSRDIYVRYSDKVASSDTAESMTKFMLETAIPAIKKTDRHIISKSENLTKEQKAELKLTHDYAFGDTKITVLSFKTKLNKNEASYDYQEYKIGDLVTRCIGAATLINYIPMTLAVCEDKESDDWTNLEKKIQQYVKSMIKLNSD